MEAQLRDLIPSLRHVLADVLHVMKRVFETLTPHHPKIGESQHHPVQVLVGYSMAPHDGPRSEGSRFVLRVRLESPTYVLLYA
jgi:hypothetical protein